MEFVKIAPAISKKKVPQNEELVGANINVAHNSTVITCKKPRKVRGGHPKSKVKVSYLVQEMPEVSGGTREAVDLAVAALLSLADSNCENT